MQTIASALHVAPATAGFSACALVRPLVASNP
jgi:hypothetical protein